MSDLERYDATKKIFEFEISNPEFSVLNDPAGQVAAVLITRSGDRILLSKRALKKLGIPTSSGDRIV